MKLNFWKMNGSGNDFICLDNRKKTIQLSRKQISHLCHRQTGVGADGVLMIEPSKRKEADFRMRYYNADGGEADMCGNGARCFARYAQKVLRFKRGTTRFETGAGLVTAEFLGDEVRVELTCPQDLNLNIKLKLSTGNQLVHFLNTGVPHVAYFVKDVEAIDVLKVGAELRFHSQFQPKGTNVNFAQLLGGNQLKVRTYERGVEGETLACGTGVTAVALIASEVYGLKSPVSIVVKGGDTLKVYFQKKGLDFNSVKLHGPADFVFKGETYV